ncbi:MAG: hypothetical protein U5L08_01525 [Xanthomonadales bacterium]|nr:hypothetical protein [Xanthomonadales bacterium]
MAHLSTAAELGHRKAQHLLGMHKAAGEDVKQDYEEAFSCLGACRSARAGRGESDGE